MNFTMNVTEPLKTIESPAEFTYLNIRIRPIEKNKSGQWAIEKIRYIWCCLTYGENVWYIPFIYFCRGICRGWYY